ncbi:MAG: FAD:protein FMN transferase [Actinomycetota bacterium]|nr:FAD:protein FMN transferase [Actinomycetota bacterium]
MVAAALPGLRRVEHVMGMPIVIDLRDEGAGDDMLDAAFDAFRAVDARFSTYRDDSEIMRINRGGLALADAHADMREIVGRCEELRSETRGYFDMRATPDGAIDPSGLVKGWSVDRVAALLDDAGMRDYAVSAGGDVIVRGRALPDDCWHVGIQHPTIGDKLAKVVAASDLAIATSGAYARGDHVLDPHTGRPPEGVLSVTITGPELATADAYATAAFAMGASGPAWTARLRGYEAMTILADGRVLSTPGFPAA